MLGPTAPPKRPGRGFESVLHGFLALWPWTRLCLSNPVFSPARWGSTHLADLSGSGATRLCRWAQGNSLG